MMRCITTFHSPVGVLTAASDGERLLGLWIEGQKHRPTEWPQDVTVRDDLTVFLALQTWMTAYFAGERPSPLLLPLSPRGTAFQQTVWRALLDIPYGETTTYGAIAKRIAPMLGKETMSAQAIGRAVGHNPISIIIPCHRVIGADGSLTGYAGGLHLKTYLLTHEGVTVTKK